MVNLSRLALRTILAWVRFDRLTRLVARTSLTYGAFSVSLAMSLYMLAASIEATALGGIPNLRGLVSALPLTLLLAAPVGCAAGFAVHQGSGAIDALNAAGVHPAVWSKPLFVVGLVIGALQGWASHLTPTHSSHAPPAGQWLQLGDWLIYTTNGQPIDLIRVQDGRLRAYGKAQSWHYKAGQWQIEGVWWRYLSNSNSVPTNSVLTIQGPTPEDLKLALSASHALKAHTLSAAHRVRQRLGLDTRELSIRQYRRVVEPIAACVLTCMSGFITLRWRLSLGPSLGLTAALTLSFALAEMLFVHAKRSGVV